MSKRTIVVLTVLDDDEQRPWWAAMGLQHPDRWAPEHTFGDDVWVILKVEEEVPA